MKRILIILSLLMLMLLLNGCWDRREVNDVAIILGAAIDKEENEDIELSVQVFIPKALSGGGGMTGGAGGGGGGGGMTLVRSANGSSLADAASKLQLLLPRHIFWGHTKIFIFGEEMAKKGIADEVDYLFRHPEPRNRAYTTVYKGKAKDVLEILPPLERASSEILREIFNFQTGIGITTTELRKMLRGEGEAAAIPMIGILPPPKGGKETQTAPFVSGTAIFKKDRMIDQISPKTTRGAMWLRNEIQNVTISVKMKNEKGFMVMRSVLAKTRLLPQIDKGKWKMRVKIRAEGDLVQNGTNLDPMDPKVIKDIEQALNQETKSRIQQTLSKVQKEMKADIFGFGTEFHRVYPREWGKVEDRWDEVFPNVQVKLEIETYVRRPGMSTVPGGIPEKEVKK